jgi:hypothetical protein
VKSRTVYSPQGAVVAEYVDGELVYAAPEFAENSGISWQVMPDIQPYQSMVDGRMVTSRSQHREMLKSYGLVEVGNETKHLKKKPVQPPPGLKETLARVAYEKLRY